MTRPATSSRATGRPGAGSTNARRTFGLLGTLASVSLLGLLSACAGTSPTTTTADIPVAQETARYQSHARSYYAPPGPPDDPWGPYIDEASKRFDVPDAWIRAVMHQESGGHQFIAGALTTSPVGAMGLMQLMAPTYDDMRQQYSLGDDAFEPHDNIMAGTAYVRQMYDIYGSPGFLAAYNTGPGRLDDFLTRNRPLPRETRQYVAIIGPEIAGTWPNNRSQTDLMVASHSGSSGVMYAAAQSSDDTRSVRMAWTRRRDLNQVADQPVQVAEAPVAGTAAPAPAYIHAWTSLPATPDAPAPSANAVSAAWAARGRVDPAVANPVSADPAPADPAPVAVAEAAPARSWSAAPTPNQVTGVIDPVQQATAPASAPALAEAPVHAPVAAPATARSAPTEITSEDASASERPVVQHARFQLIRPAMAEQAPLLRDAGHGARDWSIQVGAFGTQAQASEAAGAAQSHAPSLSHARAEIAGVRQMRGGKVYRARLTGLSRGDALQACQRLAHGRSDCMVVSPDARS